MNGKNVSSPTFSEQREKMVREREREHKCIQKKNFSFLRRVMDISSNSEHGRIIKPGSYLKTIIQNF